MCILAEDHALDRGFFSASLADPLAVHDGQEG